MNTYSYSLLKLQDVSPANFVDAVPETMHLLIVLNKKNRVIPRLLFSSWTILRASHYAEPKHEPVL